MISSGVMVSSGSAVSSFKGVMPRFGECVMGPQELTAAPAFHLPDTLARVEGFGLVRAPRFPVPFGSWPEEGKTRPVSAHGSS